MTSYPIRRRGEKRRLLPNLEGIAWLEGNQFRYKTAIATSHRDHHLTVDTDGTLHGYLAVGRPVTGYHRRMIDLYRNNQSSTFGVSTIGCPDCDDWSRTANCTDHPDNMTVISPASANVQTDRRSFTLRAYAAQASTYARTGHLLGDW